ncbi:MAG: hypothetical protein U0793_18125 [Gemmataceae bacterium]
MSKRIDMPRRIAPLQHVVAEDITDPAEQARLDAIRRRKKQKTGARAERDEEIPQRIAPLQHVVAEDITDPAEQARLDKLRRRLKAKGRTRATRKRG